MNTILNDAYFMKQALAEATVANEEGEVPIGAIVVCENRIIARAHNLSEKLNDVTAHAEMLALTAAASMIGCKYLIDCIIYVTIEPCPMCAGALAWSQIGRIVYGADDEKRGYTRHTPNMLHPKTIVRRGVLAEEATQMMKGFFKERR